MRQPNAASEVAALFLDPADEAWIRAAHIAYTGSGSAQEMVQKWSLAGVSRCASAGDERAAISEQLGRVVFEAQRGPMVSPPMCP
jgi:hypothetical protein